MLKRILAPVAHPSAPAADPDSPSWLFPIDKLNESLPSWLRFGGEYRDRLEGPIGIGFRGTNDFYLLDRLRVNCSDSAQRLAKVYTGKCRTLVSFFNHHIANANPFRGQFGLFGKATLSLGVPHQVASMRLQGRQVLLFGDERVIGPSNWTNVGRTF